MNTAVPEQNAQQIWNEVAAENAGKPAPKPAAPQPAALPAAVAPEKPSAAPDPLAEINARLAEFEKIGARMRNVEGHIGNLNGAQKELKAMLDAGKTAAGDAPQAPSHTEIKQAVSNPAEWDELKKDYPEWATATEKLLDARVNSGFDAKAFEANIKEQIKGQTQAVRKEMINDSLDAVFPGWQDEVKTPSFNQWANGQTEAVKALIYSDKIGDAARMLKLYESAKLADPAAQIIAQRQAKLNAATATPKGVRSTGSPQKSWDDMSSQERWDYEKRQKEKRKR